MGEDPEKHGRNRQNRNSCWGKFINYLDYKSNKLIKVNPSYTSQMCNKCGRLHKLDLKERIYTCECGNTYDRDTNAARNIYCLGQAILRNYTSKCALGTTEFLKETLPFMEG